MKLPPLYEPPILMTVERGKDMAFDFNHPVWGYGEHSLFAEDQLRAYGLACAEAMRDECAKACEAPSGKSDFAGWPLYKTYNECASAIRSIEVER